MLEITEMTKEEAIKEATIIKEEYECSENEEWKEAAYARIQQLETKYGFMI